MKASQSKKISAGVVGAAAVLVAAVAATMAHGGDPSTSASSQAPVDPASSGLLAAKDPATGQLRAPTAEEAAQLQSTSAPSTKAGARKAMPVRQLANGAFAVTLDSSYEMASVAVKRADGKVVTACVPANRADSAIAAAQTQPVSTKEVLDEK